MTLVNRRFVPQVSNTGRWVSMCNTTGTQRYPVARVEIEIDGEQYVGEVAVSDKLQEDALLGADIPLWVHFLKSLKPEEMAGVKELVLNEECSYAAITRAQAQKSSTEETGAGVNNTDLPLKDPVEEEQRAILTHLQALMTTQQEQLERSQRNPTQLRARQRWQRRGAILTHLQLTTLRWNQRN